MRWHRLRLRCRSSIRAKHDPIPCTVFTSLRCKNLHMTGTRVHAIIPGFHAVRRSGLGDVDAAIGTAWSPALGAPIRITRSREFDEVALLSFARPVPPLLRDGIPPNLAIAICVSDQTSSPRRLRVTPQAMPQGGDSKRPHSLRFFAIAFEVRRRIPRRPLSEGACEAMGLASAIRPSAPALTTITNQSKECP